MARVVDKELPDDLYNRLSGSDLDAVTEKAILICTVDTDGWPRPAMLSYFEVIAKDRRNIRLATYNDSSATNNMRRNGRLTICIIDKRVAYYVKGTAHELKPALHCSPHISKLNVRVDQVLADHADEQFEGEAYVTGGLTYKNPHLAAEKAKAKEVLREVLE